MIPPNRSQHWIAAKTLYEKQDGSVPWTELSDKQMGYWWDQVLNQPEEEN